MRATVAVTLFNALFLLTIALVRRHPPKRGVDGLVLFFIVAEVLWMLLPPRAGAFGIIGIVAFFFVRFRLPEKLSYALHAFYVALAGVLAILAPHQRAQGDKLGPVGATVLTVVFTAVFVALALGLQIHGTRRVRREILDEWREPLTSAREQARMRDELHYAREMQLAMKQLSTASQGWFSKTWHSPMAIALW